MRREKIEGTRTNYRKKKKRGTYCDDGVSKLQLRFVPDNKLTEISLEILDKDSEGNITMLASGGPYSTSKYTIINEFYIDHNINDAPKYSNRHIIFKFIDEGSDRLQSYGVI